MASLEFSVVALINAAVGGAIGGLITFAVGWWSTREIRSDVRENLDVVVTVARGLQELAESGKIKFNYDEEGKPKGIHLYMSAEAGAYAVEGASAELKTEDEGKENA